LSRTLLDGRIPVLDRLELSMLLEANGYVT
jgi:hypothetical protein